MKLKHGLIVLTLTAALIGCGGNGSSGGSASTATPPSTTPGATPTPTPTNTSFDDAHGELVLVDRAGSAGQELAFLPDGQDEAYEIEDPSSLIAADARMGQTVTVDGDTADNTAGKTGLAKTVKLSDATPDEVTAYGRLIDVAGSTRFRTIDGATYSVSGPEAAALSAHPLDRPVFVCGTKAQGSAGELVVSEWRPTTELTVRIHGGMLGYDETLRILDLDRRGAYRYHKKTVLFAQNNEYGRGLLPRDTDLADIAALVPGADLRAQPSLFTGPPIMDVPMTTIELNDAQGEVKVGIQFRATLPAGLEALVTELRDTLKAIPSYRVMAKGNYSGIRAKETHVARSQRALNSIWARHNRMRIPQVDFQDEFVVAAFRGATNEVLATKQIASLERIGDDLYITTRDRMVLKPLLKKALVAKPLLTAQPKITAATSSPPSLTLAAGASQPSTPKLSVIPKPAFPALPGIIKPPVFFKKAPFVFAAVEHAGVKGKVFVDGKEFKRPLLPRLPLLPKFPKIPLLPKPLPPIVTPLPRPFPPIVVNPQPRPLPPIVVNPQPRPLPPIVVAQPKPTVTLKPVVQPTVKPTVDLKPSVNVGVSLGGGIAIR